MASLQLHETPNLGVHETGSRPARACRVLLVARAVELQARKVGITLDLYSHVLPGMQEDAAARVDDALRMALQKRRPKGIG
jgi:hypothetical protein